jgi:hypothetical protein
MGFSGICIVVSTIFVLFAALVNIHTARLNKKTAELIMNNGISKEEALKG